MCGLCDAPNALFAYTDAICVSIFLLIFKTLQLEFKKIKAPIFRNKLAFLGR